MLGLIRVAGVFDQALIATRGRRRPLSAATARVRDAFPGAILELARAEGEGQAQASLAAFGEAAGFISARSVSPDDMTLSPNRLQSPAGPWLLEFVVADAKQAGSELQILLDAYAATYAEVCGHGTGELSADQELPDEPPEERSNQADDERHADIRQGA